MAAINAKILGLRDSALCLLAGALAMLLIAFILTGLYKNLSKA